MGGQPPEASGGPRVCDIAATALARRWRHRYPFQDSALKLERDVQFAAFRNTWRPAHGLKPLPHPEPLWSWLRKATRT